MDRMPIASRKVARRNVSRQVADIIRDMILTGELPPEAPLTQDEMSQRLGVSTMPVREAFLRLAHEGFVEAPTARTFRVASITRADVVDVYWAHALLAAELTARACRNAAAPVADQLDRVNAEWDQVPDGAMERLEQLNWEFHRTINLAANAPRILAMLRQTIRYIPDRFYTVLPEWRERSHDGHVAIAAAIRSGDEQAARNAARRHVSDAAELLINYFSDHGYWREPAEK